MLSIAIMMRKAHLEMTTLGYVGNFVGNNMIARVKHRNDDILQNIYQTKHLRIKNLYNHPQAQKS